ncbi:MAG: hypothetical protein M0Z95_20555 [Actinomycetota bacterium]|nr:hypothetical protein [Actinomycetota bacterium]
MTGRWATGIPPRNFKWIIKDRLGVSERPGGYAPSHRRIRRQEEIIWLRVQGFDRVISLLPSPHNLSAYEERDLAHAHFPFPPGADPRPVLRGFYDELEGSLAAGHRVLVHQEELGDRVMGVVAGFLVWSRRLPSGPQAVALVETLVGHQMGSVGRELVVVAGSLPAPRSRRAETGS